MKKSILLFASLILLGLNTTAQEMYNLIIFSEEGDGFFAYVNGIRQNDKPETNVKITGLTAEALSLRVEFENKAFPKLKQNLIPEPGYEHTVRIKTNTKKEQKLQYFGKVGLADAPKGSGSAVAYHSAENPIAPSSTQVNTANDDGNTTITTTSTTTKVNSKPNDGSLNINMGGVGINMNVSGMDGMSGTEHSTTSTTVVTKTTSSSSSTSSNGALNNNTKTSTKTNSSAQPATTSGCNVAINGASYDKMKKSIEDKPFSDTKMSTAKLATKNSCLSVAQVKGICSLFSMDEDKLTYAKYAYDYCVEKSNFYQVSEIFSFSDTTDDFNKFLEAK